VSHCECNAGFTSVVSATTQADVCIPSDPGAQHTMVRTVN
jgi:hypothetical protein